MEKFYEPDGLDIDYNISSEFDENPKIFKDAAVHNISMKKDNDENDLLFKEDYNLNDDILKEVNDLGSL